MSQGDLGKHLGMAHSGISDIELGKRGVDVFDLQLIAEILGVSIAALLPEWFENGKDAEVKLLSMYRQLSDAGKNNIEFLLRSLVTNRVRSPAASEDWAEE